ncbi:aarF domain-containing protein kinase 1-like [Saccoglossus kowalevskii]|uniref:Uncharacterized aarF domain-containing protein kinase 1-like n=1 Tax=Saccoglossus kowalevskii TaxID=10224 RepID=A0ABM0H0B1_SACKO|nr:PREDICTED: uncharacterized aarF domain-containing protein kinase 1-like [Saccoglossus kowalevskii]
MVMRNSRNLIKYLVAGGVTLSSLEYLRRHDFNLSSIGLVRFGRAFAVAINVFIDYKVSMYGVDSQQEDYQELKNKIHLRSAVKLRTLCCVNGGVFIKVGQYVGALEYLLPKEYVETMKVLHNDAPQSSLQDMCKVIKEDLGKDVGELFTSFSEKPIGAASLAQVHKATLHDGTTVAVKVQHADVQKHSYVDMKTMEFLLHIAARLFPEFRIVWLAEETKRNLPRELDFILEGQNCERVARMFAQFKFLKVPKVYWSLTTNRVLTMEFCEGGKVDDKEYMKQHDIDVDKISKDLGKLYSEMIFVHGYVHCDPHPGNIFIHKTLQGQQEIVLLDHGLYQVMTDDFRLNYAMMWQSLINADIEGIKKYSEALGAGQLYGLLACVLTARSWNAVTTGIGELEQTDAESDEIKEYATVYLPQISELLNNVPRQMLLLLKTNDLLRGIEWTLQTRANASSFINMSRCCVRALSNHQLKSCDSWVSRTKIRVREMFTQRKIDLYEMYMWLRTTYFGSLIFQLFYGPQKPVPVFSGF